MLNSCLGQFQKDLKRRQFCVMTIEVLLKVFKLFGRIEERQKENSLHFEMQLVLCKRSRGINSRQTVVSLIISLSKNHYHCWKMIVLGPSFTLKNYSFWNWSYPLTTFSRVDTLFYGCILSFLLAICQLKCVRVFLMPQPWEVFMQAIKGDGIEALLLKWWSSLVTLSKDCFILGMNSSKS